METQEMVSLAGSLQPLAEHLNSARDCLRLVVLVSPT